MNAILRNSPKPPLVFITPDCGLSQRREVVANLCDRVNELLEYAYFLAPEDKIVPVPAQSNIDERMPLRFMRPCIDALNGIIEDCGLELDPLSQMGNNMDYHGFIPWVNKIIVHMNAITEAL